MVESVSGTSGVRSVLRQQSPTHSIVSRTGPEELLSAIVLQDVYGRGETMITILIVLLVLMLLGAVPAWPHSRSWGYGPSSGLGIVLLILLILFLTGRI